MLPRSRVVCVMLLGLSATLLVVGALLPHYLHADNRLPLSLGYTTLALRDEGATIGDGEEAYRGPAVRQFHAELMDPVDEREVTLRIGSTLSKDTAGSDLERLVSARVWNYRMDRITGAALGEANLSEQVVGPAQTVNIGGLWAKFPMDTEEETYEVFDETLRQTRPAEFQGAEERQGREIMHFQQRIEPTNVATLYAGSANTTVFAEPDGATTQGYLFHSVTRDWFVDKATGLIVEVRENVDDFYGTREGQKRQQVLLFNGATTADSASALLDQAAAIPDGRWVEYVQWGLLGAGAVLALVGLLGIFGVGSRRGAGH